MIPEYGQLCLIIAFLLSLVMTVVPLAGTYNGKIVWMSSARSLAAGIFVFIAAAFAILCWAFYTSDFSVKYVASNSNSMLPTVYKLTAVWGGHEGSILLWIFMLAGWTFAVAIFSKRLPLDIVARVLSVLGFILVGFLLFTLLTSNPFDRILPMMPSDGQDLNPLLQDFGMIIHPPILYMGYVGFSVVFAFAIAALLSGRLDSAWARWSRPWTNLAWSFLTVGIALGSWWAYYELGWGGWWFWDPVENASFMPWLVGTALIHSLAMTEKRGSFKNWTLLLAIFTFSLSLLGTFLVRSGVLTSVHAFAADPERGVFILGFLLTVIGGSLALFGWKAPQVRSVSGFKWLSREAFLLFNSIIMLVSVTFVLLGTLFPLISEAMNMGKISVGAPWFNVFFVKLMAVVAALMGTGIMLNWKRTDFSKIRKWQLIGVLISVFLGLIMPAVISDTYYLSAVIAVTLGSWVIVSSLVDIWRKTRNAGSFGGGLLRLNASYYGMTLGHIGFGFVVLGVALTSIYDEQRDVRMSIGTPLELGSFTYELEDVRTERGPNYMATVGEVIISDESGVVAVLEPQKRRYFSGGNIMTEAAIDAGFFRDLYVALGEQLNNTDYALRLHYKPVVRWIWLGAIFIGLGGFIAIMDKRYKLARIKDEEALARSNASAETPVKSAEAPSASAGSVG